MSYESQEEHDHFEGAMEQSVSHPTTDERFDEEFGLLEIAVTADGIPRHTEIKAFIHSEISLALKEKEEQMVTEIDEKMYPFPTLNRQQAIHNLTSEENKSIIKRIMNTSDV